MAHGITAHHVAAIRASPSKPERYLRAADLPVVTGLSSSTLWRLERRGKFPARRQLSDRCVAWLASEVEQWMHSRPMPGATAGGT
jgi:prophage regulatory protein